MEKLKNCFQLFKLFGSQLSSNVWNWQPIDHFMAALVMALGIVFTRYLFQFFAAIIPIVCTGLAIVYLITGFLKFISELFRHAKR